MAGPPFVHGETVVRLRAVEATNAYGDIERDWANAAEARIDGCALAPTVEQEFHQPGRDGVEVGWTLYAPYAADVTAYDRIEHHRYGMFEVDGEPGLWRSPFTGREAGMTVRLRRVEG